MSSEIFYNKAFIKVGDGYIPLANHGSSNCFDISMRSGREIPEKHWSALNYPHYNKLIFTADEIREQAKVYEAASTNNRGGTKKSRYTSFEVGEFERWILAGMKSAKTVEDYVAYGNMLYLVDYGNGETVKKRVYSTDELLRLLEEHKESKELNITFFNEREVIRPASLVRKGRDWSTAERFFVLVKGSRGFFAKMSSKRMWFFHGDRYGLAVRKFATKKDAEKYLMNYADRFRGMPMSVECVQNENRKVCDGKEQKIAVNQ